MNEKLFKLRLDDRERVWAEKLEENKARIDNIPVSNEFGFNDIVSYDPITNKVIEILEKKTNTVLFQYEPQREHWKSIVDYFKSKDIATEGLMPGLGSIALPVDYDEDKFQELMNECPQQLYGLNTEEDEEE